MSRVGQTMEIDQYGNAAYRTLSPSEKRKADDFLEKLQKQLPAIEEELKSKYDPTSLKFKYELGRMIDELLQCEGFSPKERTYVFIEIKGFVSTGLNDAIKDRSSVRTYYEYCYRLYKLGEELAFSFNYHFWSDVFDRVALEEDKRLYKWFLANKDRLTGKLYRFFAKTMTIYLKDIDPSVFNDEEYFEACDLCFEVALQYKLGVKEFFGGKEANMSKARREKLGKYKNKYVEEALTELRFATRSEWVNICQVAFINTFVDVDKTSQNLKK